MCCSHIIIQGGVWVTAKIEIKDPFKKITIESDNIIKAETEDFRELVRLLDEFKKACNVEKFEYKTKDDGWSYFFKHVDGREWDQHIRIGSITDMNFDVPEHWTLSEFSPHRPLRDKIIDMTKTYKIKDITVKWD